MRRYDYRCGECGKEFELEHELNDTSKHRGPKCKSTKIRKIIRASPLIFRGDGFTLSKSE